MARALLNLNIEEQSLYHRTRITSTRNPSAASDPHRGKYASRCASAVPAAWILSCGDLLFWYAMVISSGAARDDTSPLARHPALICGDDIRICQWS
jgi:hypothetical protein